MEELDSGAHSSYSLYYHLVWAPKYRRRVLDGKVGERAKQIIEETSAKYGYELDTLKVSPDHIHLLLSLPPRMSVAEAARTLKSITARTLLREFPELKRHLWQGNLWTRGYAVTSVGGLNLDVVRNYITTEQEP
jgi:putative transposase